MLTFQNHLVIDGGIGLMPGAPVEFNREAFRKLFSDTPEGEARRQRLKEVAATQRAEFQAHDIEIGFRYDVGAIVPDGTPVPFRGALGDVHTPAARPGHRVPHAWLERERTQFSTLDLVGRGRFVLIVNGEDSGWRSAAQKAAQLYGVPVDVVTVGSGGDYQSADGRWDSVSGTEPGGAVLVRPDGHVAWRAARATDDPVGRVSEVLGKILNRKVNVSANACCVSEV